MTPELKAKWLENLKSGKYPKTVSFLKNKDGYCCLGVLLETMGHTEWKPNPYSFGKGACALVSSDVRLAGDQEMTALGIDTAGITREQHNKLTNLNDTYKTFDNVIGYIEREI